jgi:hypothetical protein
MAEHKSDQIAGQDATPVILAKASALHGRVRVAYWSFTTPTGGVAISDTITLVRLPRGARVLGGHFTVEAMSSGGGAATLSLGVAGAATRYLEATSVDAATAGDFADTIARNFGDERAAETDVIATASVEAWAAARRFDGWLAYAVD